MSPEQLVQSFADVLGSGDLDALDAIVAPDCVDANPVPMQPPGRVGVALKLAVWRAAAPLARSTIEMLGPTPTGAEARWTTNPGTGEPPSRWWGRFVVRDARIQAFEVDRVG